ncbi:MAG: polymorphic toxin type 50 domain-containing protein [Chlamydiia bacterium]
MDPNTGATMATTRAQIHYSKKGIHLVPSRPNPQ